MTPEQVRLFFDAFSPKDQIYRDLAVWGDGKRFDYLKRTPKNECERWTYMNNRLEQILRRRIEDRSEIPCQFADEETGQVLNFVFHIDGQPLTYRQVQYHYNKTLKRCGLDKDFSSTHFMRKAAAKAIRDIHGVETAQVYGGWKDRKIVEDIYTDAPDRLVIEASKIAEQVLYDDSFIGSDNDPTKRFRIV